MYSKVKNVFKISSGKQVTCSQKKHPKKPDIVRMAKFVQQIQDISNQEFSKLMKTIAEQLKVAESIIRHAVHEDIIPTVAMTTMWSE